MDRISELTKRGVAKDIATTPYRYEIHGLTLHFTSEFTRKSFYEKYSDYKEDLYYRTARLFKISVHINEEQIIISLYKQIEKRGFYITKGDKCYISPYDMYKDKVI